MTTAQDRIRHRPGCQGAELYETTGRLGDPMTRCRGCGRFVLAAELATVAATQPAPTPAPTRTPRREPPPPAPPRLVCRGHYSPVTWKGTGCPSCEAERAERVATQERQRRAALRAQQP